MPRQPTRRAPRGEGSIYYRADRQRWLLAITLTDAEGRRVPRTWSFRTEAEARRKRRQVLHARDQGQAAANERQTVGQFLEKYERLAIAGRAANTRRAHRSALTCHLLPAFGHLPLVQLRTATIQGYVAQMQTDGYTPNHIRSVIGILRAALHQAVAWEELARNPATGVRLPKATASEPPMLEPEQIQRLLGLVRGDRLEAALWLSCTTGMRIAEVLGLHWTDVHLDRGTVTVHQQATRGEGIKAVKTGQVGARTIPLAAPTRAALERHRARGTNGPLVFPTKTGRPITHTWFLLKWWRPLLVRAGLREEGGPTVYKPHGLRHCCGSFLLWLGMDLAQVSRILGHSSVAITAQVYSHALERGERGMMEQLGALLSPPEPDPEPSPVE